jgi:hypothetical protein
MRRASLWPRAERLTLRRLNFRLAIYETTSSRLWIETFSVDRDLWLCCWSAAMALATPFPYAGSAFEQLPI